MAESVSPETHIAQTAPPGEADRFRNILDCLPQMVWANEGAVEYYNRRWHEFTGAPLGERTEAVAGI